MLALLKILYLLKYGMQPTMLATASDALAVSAMQLFDQP